MGATESGQAECESEFVEFDARLSLDQRLSPLFGHRIAREGGGNVAICKL